jgi:hypothetical protein
MFGGFMGKDIVCEMSGFLVDAKKQNMEGLQKDQNEKFAKLNLKKLKRLESKDEKVMMIFEDVENIIKIEDCVKNNTPTRTSYYEHDSVEKKDVIKWLKQPYGLNPKNSEGSFLEYMFNHENGIIEVLKYVENLRYEGFMRLGLMHDNTGLYTKIPE